MKINEIEKPPKQALEGLLGVEHKDKKKWLDKFLKNTAKVINADKKTYRSYGHFWWLLKSLLIKHGYQEFGGFEQDEFRNALSNDDESLDAVACWLYQYEKVESAMTYSSEHEVSLIGGKTCAYTLVDEDVERLIVVEMNQNKK
ncbi:MAG: hypothetical protein HRU38_00045 [Saccharospirillaceae bacterium]|nr:hypothetical protein [Pseudomonadales bacterium]NRB77052.1 hypothetical protein [Saccharospirillaceae bacterium]